MRIRHQTWTTMAITALAFGVMSGIATAEDFTFTVPVEIANLPPEINYGIANCELIIREPGRSARAAGNVGRGFRISGGAYRAEVTVAVNAAPGVEPGNVTHYKCYLELQGTLRGTPVSYNFRDEGFTLPLPVAAGAPFTPRVEGAVR